jgi:hypothetical protein
MNAQEPITLPAPVLEPLVPLSKFERERQAFQRLLPELLKTHRGKYVAIHEERMVDSDTDQVALLLRVHAQHGYVPVYSALVAEQQPIYRLPHYREYWPQGPE